MNEPLLPTTAAPKQTWISTRSSAVAVCLGLVDLVVMNILYLLAYNFDIKTLWDADITHYQFGSSLADVYVIMMLRLWISTLALQFRWSFLGIAAGVVSAGVLVAKAAEFTLWAIPAHTYQDTILVLQLFFSVIGPAVTIPIAISSLQAHKEMLASMQAQDGEPPKKSLSGKQLMIVLKPYFWPQGMANRVRAVGTLFILAVSKTCNIIAPLFLGTATNAITKGDVRAACVAVGTYCAVKFISSAFKEFQSMAYLKVKQAAYIEIAQYTFRHLHSLSLDWHLRKKMGNTLRAMDRGVESANSVVNYLFLYLLPTMVECLIVVFVFLLHFKSALLALLVFFSLVLYAHVTIKLTLWRKKFREYTNKSDNEFHDRATDSLINYETVKYFNAEAYETKRYCSAVSTYQKYSTSTQYSLSLLNIAQQLLQQGCMCIAMIIMIYTTSDVGAFVAVQAYLLQLFVPLNFLGTIYGVIVNGLVDMQNLSELLAEQPDLTDLPGAQELVCSSENPPAVEYRDVSFHYPTQDPMSGLNNVCFTAEAGKTTAVVGATGSGKTTLGRLLFRFYDPLKGSVIIAGRNIAHVTQASVRRSIGVVPQDTVMFNDSILHNLKYGRMDATMAEVEAVCEQAQILDFIVGLPEKWETKVGERGLKLSGGEKQRVAIARCLLKNPPIVLLDEATSALDSRTEREVQGSLNDLGQNRTTLVIAHRLSTIRNAGRIIVMNKGVTLENGTHDELVAVQGAYAALWNAQAHEAVSMTPSNSTAELVKSAEA